jgi:hypothetical protein
MRCPLAALLRAQREHTTDVERSLGLLCPMCSITRGSQSAIRRAWRSACRRAATAREGTLASCVPTCWSAFRMTFAQRCGTSCVLESLRGVAMELTEHKTRSVFDRYNIVNERDLREGVSKLAALRGGGQQRDNRGNAGVFAWDKSLRCIVAREGIEPPTRGFSVRCSTN